MTELQKATITADEARKLTDETRDAGELFLGKLLETYETGAWGALGYASWREYAVDEFQFSERHAYRLLTQAQVIREIETGADCPIGQKPSESQARELAKIPEGQRAEVWQKVVDLTDGKPTAAAIREASWPEVSPDTPKWGTPEAKTADIIACRNGHIAARETFEDVDGCPYCVHTPGERQAALSAMEAYKARQRENTETTFILPQTLSPEEREQRRREQVATDLLTDLILSLSQLAGSDEFDYYQPTIARPRPINTEMLGRAVESIDKTRITLTSKGML